MKLRDVCEIKYGKDHKKLADGDIPVYGSGGIIRHVESALDNGPSVLIPRKGTLGNLFFVDQPFWTVDTLFWTKIDSKKILPKFLYYALKTKNLASLNVGTAIPSLTAKVLYEVELPDTDLSEQLRIAHVLDCLDQKVTLNNQLNDYLAEIQQTLYREWANDGELVSIEDIASVIDCLHSKKPSRKTEGKPLIQLNNIFDDGILDMSDSFLISESDYERWISRCEVQQGDCVITNVGRIGAVSQAPKDTHAAMGRNMTCIRPNSYPATLITALCSREMRREIDRRTDTGTIMNALNVRNIPKLELVIPSADRREYAEKCLRCIQDIRELLKKNNNLLSSLRDTLLPKLMSGEIDVSEVVI